MDTPKNSNPGVRAGVYNFNMEYSGDDFYCDVAVPGKTELQKEFESKNVLAFHHTRPSWPIHIVVVPKRHISSFTNRLPEDESVFQEVLEVVKSIAAKIEAEHGAARILTNLGAYQDSKHLHFHVCSGEPIKS